MNFEIAEKDKDPGVVFGYILSYLIFTTILFIVVTATNKFPGANYFYFMLVTIGILLIGSGIKKLLR